MYDKTVLRPDIEAVERLAGQLPVPEHQVHRICGVCAQRGVSRRIKKVLERRTNVVFNPSTLHTTGNKAVRLR